MAGENREEIRLRLSRQIRDVAIQEWMNRLEDTAARADFMQIERDDARRERDELASQLAEMTARLAEAEAKSNITATDHTVAEQQ